MVAVRTQEELVLKTKIEFAVYSFDMIIHDILSLFIQYVECSSCPSGSYSCILYIVLGSTITV